jgi:hypothetical protein
MLCPEPRRDKTKKRLTTGAYGRPARAHHPAGRPAPRHAASLTNIRRAWYALRALSHIVCKVTMQSALQSQVLVLNRLWQAVNICSAERAISLLYTGHAQVVHQEGEAFNTFSLTEWCDVADTDQEEDIIRSISLRIRVPRIILLLFFDRLPTKDVKFTRQNVFARDKNTCQYCGKKFDRASLNIDHVIPRQHGGATTWTNVVCSCVACNQRKANRTPQQARMKLRRIPKKPRWRPFIQIQFARTADHSWRHFLDVAYWNVELSED